MRKSWVFKKDKNENRRKEAIKLFKELMKNHTV